MDWLNALQGTLAVALVVTTGLLGLQQGTVRTLRESNSDLRARRDDQDKYVAEVEVKLSTSNAENEVLRSVVTGEAHLTALADRLEDHHTESMSALADIRSAIEHHGGTHGS